MAALEKSVSRRLYNFASELVGNRVLDIYLKYKGITTLTSATLVPIALLLGQQQFKQFIKSQKKGNRLQEGGEFKIPVIDAPGISSYLKLLGLYHMNFAPHTLVPLGVLVTLYELYKDKIQKGGAIDNKNMFFDFTRGLVGNRVLDLFLKYKGITALNAYTLVPIALILGKQVFSDYLKNKKAIKMAPNDVSEQLNNLNSPDDIYINQLGGKVKLPFVDDPLIGNYLKVVGLYHLPLTTGTLIPLGVAMVIYQLYKGQIQQGGFHPAHPKLLTGGSRSRRSHRSYRTKINKYSNEPAEF